MKTEIRISERIMIQRSPETVWDYTQDFSRRTEWDSFIIKATVLEEKPKKVRIKGKGNFSATLVYKQYDRPYKTSLVFADVQSPLIAGGGGSWRYEKKENGTLWTQMGTCSLKRGLLSAIMLPLVRLMLKHSMKTSMKAAKRIMERNV